LMDSLQKTIKKRHSIVPMEAIAAAWCKPDSASHAMVTATKASMKISKAAMPGRMSGM